jgi:tetratricopeptide (TPR) repeat protein
MLPKLRYRWIALFLAFASLLALNPTPTPRALVLSVVDAAQALADGRPMDAAAEFEAALELEPSNASLHFHAAQSYLLASDAERALSHLDAAEELSADEAALQKLRGEALLALGDLQGATISWENAGQDLPLPEEILRSLAHTYLDLGKAAEAYTAFGDLVALLPEDVDALVHLGLLAASGTPADAGEFLDLAKQHSRSAHPLVQDLINSIEVGLESESPAYQLALVGQTLLRHDEWELAEYAFRGALLADPDFVDAQAFLGLVLFELGEDGLPYLLLAIETAPDAMLPHILLGMHYLDIGETEEALRELNAAADLDASNPAILAQLGAAFDASGEVDKAMSAYRGAAELVPDNPDFWLLLAQYALSKEIDVQSIALPAARNAIALKPRNAQGLDALGYGYYLLGNFPMAERMLSSSVQLDPSLALTQYHLGLLRLAQDQISRARAALQTAVLLDSGGPIAAMAQLTLDFIGP